MGRRLSNHRVIGPSPRQAPHYHIAMLRYHVAFYLPHLPGEMVVAEALDFPGAVTQGFDLPDARLMIASALEDLAQVLLEEGKPLPVPSEAVLRSSEPGDRRKSSRAASCRN